MMIKNKTCLIIDGRRGAGAENKDLRLYLDWLVVEGGVS